MHYADILNKQRLRHYGINLHHYLLKFVIFNKKLLVGHLLSDWGHTFASVNQSFMPYETY